MLGVDENCLPSDTLGEDSVNTVGKKLGERLLWYMDRLKIPMGLTKCGFSFSDIDALVEGTLPQERVTKLAPHPVDKDVLGKLFENSLSYS